MKKNILKTSIISAALLVSLSGCSLTKNVVDSQTDITSNEESVEASSETTEDAAVSATTDEIIVVENLAEPALEEATTAASSDTVTEDASAQAATTEATTADAAAATTVEPVKPQIPVDDNLVMVFLGDSQFANGRYDGTDIASYVQARVPNGTSYNLGIGGSTAGVEQGTSEIEAKYETWTSNCFVGMCYALAGKVNRERVLASSPDVLNIMNQIDPAQVDYYFIEYGANDFFNKIPLDKYNLDYELADVYTYYGALCTGIEQLRAISPNARIVLISPFYGIYKADDGTYLGDTYITSNGFATLQDYAKKMQNVAEGYGFYFLDTMWRGKFDLYLDKVDQYLIDTVHLNVTGRQIAARFIAHLPNTERQYEPMCFRTTDYVYIDNFNPDEYYRVSDEEMAASYPDQYERYINNEYLLAKPAQ